MARPLRIQKLSCRALYILFCGDLCEIFARSLRDLCEIFAKSLRDLCEEISVKLRLALLRSCFAQGFYVDDVNHRPFSTVHIEAQRSVSHGAERHAPDTRTRRQSGGGHFISKSLLLKIILRLALGITLAEIRANFGIKIWFSFLRERMPEIVL